MNTPKNLLIIRTDRIGDVVLSLPLAGIVKKHYPECKITFLVREYTRPLVENHPFIDDFIVLKEDGKKVPLFSNISLINNKKFDTSILVYPTFITALIVWLSNIKVRIGTGYRWYSVLFNRKVYVHRKYGEKHELEFNVELLKEIGINEEVSKTNVRFNLNPGGESIDYVENVLAENKIKLHDPVVIVHPGSGGSAVDLPAEKFRELVAGLLNIPRVQVLLTGSRSEHALCESLRISPGIHNFAGKFNLQQLMALINKSHIFVANSTGPIHIAAALGKFTIGFYPNNQACSSKRWGPYSGKSFVFSPVIDCDDCRREQCTHTECMNSINVTDIIVTVENIIKLLVINGEING